MDTRNPLFLLIMSLASPVFSLICALIQSALLNSVGWIRTSERLLDLSSKLNADGAEEEARRFLRDQAVSKILRAQQLRTSPFPKALRLLNRIGVASLLVLMVLCIVVVVQVWTGGVHGLVIGAYLLALLSLSLCSVGSVAILAIRKRRINRKE